jgi:hypothetical protein
MQELLSLKETYDYFFLKRKVSLKWISAFITFRKQPTVYKKYYLSITIVYLVRTKPNVTIDQGSTNEPA